MRGTSEAKDPLRSGRPSDIRGIHFSVLEVPTTLLISTHYRIAPSAANICAYLHGAYALIIDKRVPMVATDSGSNSQSRGMPTFVPCEQIKTEPFLLPRMLSMLEAPDCLRQRGTYLLQMPEERDRVLRIGSLSLQPRPSD